MTNVEIREQFQEIAKRFANNDSERAILYQFLNNLTINNTNEQVEVILNLIKINR